MSAAWFDVTTILGWNRPAVGVVRVEAEVARYVLDENAVNVAFCRFDKQQSRYMAVDAQKVRASLERIEAYQRAQPPTATVPASDAVAVPAVSNEDRIANIILGTIARLPRVMRERIHRFVTRRRDAYSAAFMALREARRSMSVLIRPPTTTPDRPLVTASPGNQARPDVVPFGPADVYVSMGLDWTQKDFAYLYAKKRQIGFKVLLFCYDLIPLKFPHLCVGDVAPIFAKYFADLAWCADQVLCISECSCRDLKDLLEVLGAPVPSLSVVRLGCKLTPPNNANRAAEVTSITKQRYILYVSTIERRKNHETLYRAYTRLVEAGRENLPLLVFVGMPGWGVADLMEDLRLDPRIRPYLKILNHVSDSDLTRLYEHSYFTVYPSLYEGWGLPVAESLACGKFCLASRAASIPEIGGRLIEYLDPWDIPAWAQRLGWYFDHPDEVKQREAAIGTSYHSTAWSETSANVLQTARNLLSREKSNTR